MGVFSTIGFVPALVYSLFIMGDVISILSEQQEAFVDEEIGDLLGEEADAIAADLGIPPRWENGKGEWTSQSEADEINREVSGGGQP